jgi:hypothetical protein
MDGVEDDALGRVLVALENETLNNAATQHDRPDGDTLVYHYTDAAGFEGIVRNQCLGATDYRFLNDRTEIKSGADAVQEVAKELAVDDTLEKPPLDQKQLASGNG